jgi:hypothetical protein
MHESSSEEDLGSFAAVAIDGGDVVANAANIARRKERNLSFGNGIETLARSEPEQEDRFRSKVPNRVECDGHVGSVVNQLDQVQQSSCFSTDMGRT